jgi:putative transposase
MRWRLIKSHFSKGCNDGFKEKQTTAQLRRGEQTVWQRRYWEHQIRDDDDFTRHVEYIHYNPVNHGLAKSPIDWPHSTFHRFVKQGIYHSDWGAGKEIGFDIKVGNE